MKKKTGLILAMALLVTTMLPNFYIGAETPATPNVTLAQFEDSFGTGVVIADDAKGVKITSDNFGKRATYTTFSQVDGMMICLADVAVTMPTINGFSSAIAFNLGTAAGHFWGSSDTLGVFIKIYTEYVGDARKSYLYIKKASDMDAVGDDIYLQPTEITVFADNTIPSEMCIQFVKNETNYDIYINGQVFSIPVNAIESNITGTGTGIVTFGGYSDVPDHTAVSYVVNTIGVPNVVEEPFISGTPVTPVIGTKNVVFNMFEDTFGTGISISNSNEGVALSSDSYGKRATYNSLTTINDMTIRLTEISVPELVADGQVAIVAFTLSTEAGHYWGSGAVGVTFRIVSSYAGGSRNLYLFIKKADDMDDIGEDIYLPLTKLAGFTDGKIPSDLEIHFLKNGEDYEISINGVVATIPASSIEGNISAQGKSLVTFGGFTVGTNSENVSYKVNFIGLLSAASSSEVSSQTSSQASSQTSSQTVSDIESETDNQQIPQTDDRSTLPLITVLVITAIATIVVNRKKVIKS